MLLCQPLATGALYHEPGLDSDYYHRHRLGDVDSGAELDGIYYSVGWGAYLVAITWSAFIGVLDWAVQPATALPGLILLMR